MRGKKSTDIQKRISGTNRADRMHNIELPSLNELPPPPDYLSETAKDFYNNILTQSMYRRNIINEFTIASWIFGCQLIGIWIDFSMTKKTAKEMAQDRDEYRVARDAFQNAIVIFKEFGLTPLAITRIADIVKDKESNDEYQKFLNG